jgi:hypothetical protein
MDRGMNFTARLGAGALSFLLLVVSSATCLAAALETPQSPHSCCAGMSELCGDSVPTQQTCCAVQAADLARLSPGAHSTINDSHTLSDPVVEPTRRMARPRLTDFDAAIATSPPTHLLFSVFRI